MVRAALLTTLALTVAGCAPEATCPADVAFSTAPVVLVTTFATLPRSPVDATFTGRDADTLWFAHDGATYEVTTRYAEWPALTPGQAVRIWSDYSDAAGSLGLAVSLFVIDPSTGALLFAVVAASGTGGGGPDPRTFSDLSVDFEMSCSGPPPDCDHPDQLLGPLPTVDGERLVVRTTTTTVRIERGETREIDGYRIYLDEASSESPLVFTVPCDATTGRGPRRGAVIARIE